MNCRSKFRENAHARAFKNAFCRCVAALADFCAAHVIYIISALPFLVGLLCHELSKWINFLSLTCSHRSLSFSPFHTSWSFPFHRLVSVSVLMSFFPLIFDNVILADHSGLRETDAIIAHMCMCTGETIISFNIDNKFDVYSTISFVRYKSMFLACSPLNSFHCHRIGKLDRRSPIYGYNINELTDFWFCPIISSLKIDDTFWLYLSPIPFDLRS